MSAETSKGVCLVIGAGDHTGGHVAEKFAAQGYTSVVTRRGRNLEKLEALCARIAEKGGTAVPMGVDARDEADTNAMFEKIEAEIGRVEVCVHNIGPNVRFGVLETTAQVYRKVWELAAFSAFLAGRAAARVMVPRERGTILFTGATGGVKANIGYAAFASAMHAKRATAQSLARELGPKNIHVAHVIIDAAIDHENIRVNFPERYNPEVDGVVDPAAIAETYWHLHSQHRSAWSFETDLRPWMETW